MNNNNIINQITINNLIRKPQNNLVDQKTRSSVSKQRRVNIAPNRENSVSNGLIGPKEEVGVFQKKERNAGGGERSQRPFKYVKKMSRSINGNLNGNRSGLGISSVAAGRESKIQEGIPTKKLLQLFKNRRGHFY